MTANLKEGGQNGGYGGEINGVGGGCKDSGGSGWGLGLGYNVESNWAAAGGGGGIVAANRAEPRRQFGVAHALSE